MPAHHLPRFPAGPFSGSPLTYPDIDKRKDFLTPTLRLIKIVEKELLRLGRELTTLADHLQFLHMTDGVDDVEARRIPSGTPTAPGALLPVDWPPKEIGTPVEPWLKTRKKS